MAYLMNKDNKKDIKVLKTSVSSLQDLQSGSFGLVTGGTISYTPRPSSTYVYYEFNTMLSYKDTPYATAQFRLRYGPDTSNLASINTNDIHYTIYMGSDGELLSYEQEDMVPLKLSFLIPAWEGEKVLALEAKEASSSKEYYLHGIKSSSTGESSDDLFDPFIIVYSY